MHVRCPGEFSDLLSKSGAECLISLNETRQLLRLNVACFCLIDKQMRQKVDHNDNLWFPSFFPLRHEFRNGQQYKVLLPQIHRQPNSLGQPYL